jgi:hypothetical protein
MPQQQNAYSYAYWTFKGGTTFWDVEQEVWIGKTAPGTYWALNWFWAGLQTGGYMGVQQIDSAQSVALFSLWDAGQPSAVTGVNNGDPQVTCGTFGGEGTGWSCRRTSSPLLATDRFYSFRVTRLDKATPADGIPAQYCDGNWWGAWVYDLATGQRYNLGLIRAPSANLLISNPMNFVEYFGEAVASPSQVPPSVVYWTQPAANYLNGRATPLAFQYYSQLNQGATSIGTGVRASSTPWTFPTTAGQQVIFGGLNNQVASQGATSPPDSHAS